MAAATWIGGFLGFITGGPLGALAGAVMGYLFGKSVDAVNEPGTEGAHSFSNGANNQQRQQQGSRNSFLFSLLVLTSYIVRADGKVMHSEMEVVRSFLHKNFGESAVSQGDDIMNKLFQQQKAMGMEAFSSVIQSACRQIAMNMSYEQRLQLVNFLIIIAKADGKVVAEELTALRQVAHHLGITQIDLESMLHMDGSSSSGTSAADQLADAYKVLGISADATDEEVKKAYRQMALKHHPDRVATLGEDVRKAAEKKFQEINAAKERIYAARGL